MKITLATPLYPPEIGGPATDASTLARVLTDDGYDVNVLPFSTVRHLPKVLRHFVYFWKLLMAAHASRAIVAFDTVSVGLPAALAARLLRKVLVVRIPGDYAWEQGVQRFHVSDTIEAFQHKQYDLPVEVLRSVQRFVVQQATLVVVPSEYFKTVVATWGILPNRLTRIYLGIDTKEASAAPINRPEGKVLFSVGRFVPWKGFTLLLHLLVACPEWRAVIAGDGPLRKTLEAQARVLGVADRVEFIGVLPRAEVLGWCVAADAFVLNTSFESFSFQILEAMHAGARIITTTAGSIPELITNGVEGVLCTPNDTQEFVEALRSVTPDAAIWIERKHAAKRKAEMFSLDASGRAFADALKTVCG